MFCRSLRIHTKTSNYVHNDIHKCPSLLCQRTEAGYWTCATTAVDHTLRNGQSESVASRFVLPPIASFTRGSTMCTYLAHKRATVVSCSAA